MEDEVDRNIVARLYSEGVEAISTVTARFDVATWTRLGCGSWDAEDTARHVFAVTRWYDQWLDRAMAGDVSLPFPESEIDDRNDNTVKALQHKDGPTAIAMFEQTAIAYLDRALQQWDVPYGYPFGVTTVGLHLGVAATEWHLHAFDFAAALGDRYEPRDASALFRAAGLGVAQTKPAFQRAALRLLVPAGARFRPWPTILRQSGRA
jgi:hypothetical protein